MKIERFEFEVSQSSLGLWYVKSPQIPGLMVAEHGLPEALEGAASALRDLALAFAWELAEGRECKPIFKDR